MVSFGGNKQRSSSVTTQAIDPAQAPFLNRLRSAAQPGLLNAATDGFIQGNTLADQLGGAARRNLFAATGLDTLSGNIDTLRTNLEDQFKTTVLPAIRSRFGTSGTGGGSRELNASLDAGDRLGRATSAGIAQLTDQFQQRAIDSVPAFQGAFNLGISGFQGGAAPLLALAQLIGDPTVLTSGSSSGSGGGINASFLGG